MLQSGIMSTAKASFWSFLTAFKDCWLVSMTGGVLAVGFTGASLLVSQDRQRFLFEAIAVLSGIVAAYGVWSSERKARCKAEDKVNQFTSIPLATQKVYVANANLALARTVAVSVVNTGKVNFVVSAAEVTVSDQKPLQEEMNYSVPTGGSVNVLLSDFWSNYKMDFVPSIDFQLRIQVKWLNREAWLEPIVCHANLDVSPNGLREIGAGYSTQRRLACPKCKGQLIPLWMNVTGTKTEEEFQERKRKYLDELTASCPQHYSQYALKSADGDCDSMGAYPG
jgi:hypothetical protein